MGTAIIRHNDLPQSMEAMARGVFGDDVQLITQDGEFGEKILYVIGEGVSPNAIDDLERQEWVLNAEYLK